MSKSNKHTPEEVRSLPWLDFLGISAGDKSDFEDLQLNKGGFLSPVSNRIEQALLAKIIKTTSVSSRIGKLKFLEYAPSILENFILPYANAHWMHANLKTLNIEKCKPNLNIMEVIEQFMLISLSSEKVKSRIEEGFWRTVFKVSLQNQIIANIED